MTNASMFKALLATQWKHQRIELIIFAIAAAGIPAMIPWNAETGWGGQYMTPTEILNGATTAGMLGAALAALTGTVIAIRPYALDAMTNHTYAMALPIPRAQYGMLRVASGMVLMLLPVAGFLVGAFFAAAATELPPMLRAYPIGITVRFALAAAMAFSLAFGVQYGLGKRAARWIVISMASLAAIEILGQFVFGESLTAPMWVALGSEASPLRVFAANWMLFDV